MRIKFAIARRKNADITPEFLSQFGFQGAGPG